jgi:hypothetical protein
MSYHEVSPNLERSNIVNHDHDPQGCTVINDPDGIAYARLATLKGALKLEKAGMKTKGGALRPRIAAEFGLKPRDSHDAFIAKVQEKMDALLAQRRAALAREAEQAELEAVAVLAALPASKTLH